MAEVVVADAQMRASVAFRFASHIESSPLLERLNALVLRLEPSWSSAGK
jgi:hypothetical protein